MSKHVVADEQVRLLAGIDQRFGGFNAEKLRDRRYPFFRRDGRDVRRRFDAQDRNARFNEVLQQVTVVACDLDDEAGGIESEPRQHQLRVTLAVLEPAVRIGRKISIVAEEFLRARNLVQLYQEAFAADIGVQRVCRFRRLQIFSPDIRVRQRRHAQVAERVRKPRRTKSAVAGHQCAACTWKR